MTRVNDDSPIFYYVHNGRGITARMQVRGGNSFCLKAQLFRHGA